MVKITPFFWWNFDEILPKNKFMPKFGNGLWLLELRLFTNYYSLGWQAYVDVELNDNGCMYMANQLWSVGLR
jgi:hypothetical protein